MAIEIPALVGFTSKVFDIGHNQQLSPVGTGGFIQTLNRSSPVWHAEYTTPPLRDDRYDACRVFLDQLEGSMNTFLAYDPRRPMPRAYQEMSVASNPWGTTPRITGQSFANSTIDLDQMTMNAVVSPGDYVSVQVGLIWYLFRAQESRAASAGGGIAALKVKPRPQIIGLAAPTAIRYKKAVCEMKLIGRPEETDSVETFPSFRFKAGQFNNRATA